jgi:hypothetical protein
MQNSRGKISFIDSTFLGHHDEYLFLCNTNPEHGSFRALLRKKTACPHCRRERMRALHQKSFEEINESLKKFGTRILFADDHYINRNTRHLFFCTKHNIEYPSTLANVLGSNSGGCPLCKSNTYSPTGCHPRDRSKRFFLEVLEPGFAATPEYKLLTTFGSYQRLHNTHLLVRHLACGTDFPVTWESWKAGARCTQKGCRPGRKAHNRKSSSDVKETIARLYDGEYRLEEEYKGMREQHKIYHIPTGQSFFSNIDNFSRGKFKRPAPHVSG